MLNEVFVLYQSLLESDITNLVGIDVAALRGARDSYLNEMAFQLRQNNTRSAKLMAFELLIFDNYMNDKFLETTKVENIPVQLSVSI